MKEQFKVHKSISQANTNIIKVCDNLKKTHEGMLRNLKILEDKLKGKEKYLKILEQKEKKEK